MLFRIGKVRVSQTVLASTVSAQDLISAFTRYIHGDWGDVDTEDELVNDVALTDGTRVEGIYTSTDGTEFCIATENGRTTIHLATDTWRERYQVPV